MPPPRPLPFSFTSSLISSSRPQTQCVPSLFIQSRQFSASPAHQKRTYRLKRFTRQRRKMFSWLNTTGAQFKVPSPDRTAKYLGGVSRDGPAEKAFNASAAARGQEGGAPAEEPKNEDEQNADSESFDPNQEERKEAEKKLDSSRDNPRESEPKRKPGPRDLKPFPLNPHFMSQPVLSEEFREIIYLQVVEQKKSVRSVSAEHGVSMERVGAVVRMKQMERDWVQQNKPLAAAYSRTVLGMLPRTEYTTSQAVRTDRKTGAPILPKPHETINDLPVHPATTQQIFHPVAESRAFTRADAGRAFHPNLLSADERIPHPQLIEIEKFKATNPSTPELRAFNEDLITKEREAAERYLERKKKREQNIQVYQGQKYDFRFQDVSVESVGKDGRARAGVGWRYGMPHEDRKPGQVKIPTRV